MKASILDVIICIIGGGAMILVVIAPIISYLNKRRFLEVCRLYELEFGFLPLSAATFKDSDIIGFSAGYWVKMDFILRPLVFGKSSGYSKNNDVEFIKKLPVSIKRWFLVEYFCITLCGIAFVVAGILLYF